MQISRRIAIPFAAECSYPLWHASVELRKLSPTRQHEATPYEVFSPVFTLHFVEFPQTVTARILTVFCGSVEMPFAEPR